MNDILIEDFLEHHGIKGQRWGVRRAREKQRHLDRVSRIEAGTATKNDIARVRIANRRRRIRNVKLAVLGAGVGYLATKTILTHFQDIKINKLRTTHSSFVDSKNLLDTKMTKRMSELRDLAKMTPPGHPSHEGAIQEINNLREFYQTRLSKMSKKHLIDPTIFKQMKLKPAI